MESLLHILKGISADIRQLHTTEVKDLENIITLYPYYAYAHMLLAKKYKMVNNPQFESQLAKAATFANNREALHQLMHKIIPTIETEQKSINSKSKKVVAITKATKPKVQKPKQKLTAEKSTIKRKSAVKKQSSKNLDTNVIQLTPSVKRKKAEQPTKPAKKHKVSPAGKKTTTTPAKTKVVALKPKKQKASNSKNTFAEWLNNTNKVAKTASKKAVKTKKDKPNFDKFSADINDITSFMDGYSQEKEEKSKLDDIINSSTTAYKLDEDLVTETYAKLLVKQGKLVKAIKSYKLLQLKYPEKSGYFAGQIKKLKKN